MRCKNCGTYNDDNRYICETCGSPLYDEEDINPTPAPEDNSIPQFSTAPEPLYQNPNFSQSAPYQPNEPEKAPAEKKSVIVIAILAVVLIAVIASVAVVAHSKSKENETTVIQSSSQITTQRHTTSKAERTTEEETTEPTTTTTTTETTTTTTQAQIWYINVFTGGGGTVKGNGDYLNGEKVTISAKPDSGYTFDGWYSDGIKISSSEKYTFTANGNMSVSAVFVSNEADNSGVENGNAEEDINFGG